FEVRAKFGGKQGLERGAVGEAQVEEWAVDFAFPFVALEWPRVSCRLDRLKVAIADAADPQHQSFLVELAVVGIEIDGKFRCTLGRFFELAKPWNFRKARQICRWNLEFQLEFLKNWHGASPYSGTGQGQTLTASRLRRFEHNFGGEFPAPVPEKPLKSLVSRFRSSQTLVAHRDANFGIKGTLATLRF